jgi:hypothetical protein
MSHHEKGAHGYGGIWGGTDVSFHHNLFAHHSSRNPRFSGGGSSDATINMDFRNNVIYNWGFNSSYGGAGATINMVANYYKSGPATLDDVKDRIVSPNDANGSWYIEENFVEGFPEITSDNWAGGVQGEYAIPSMIRVYEPLPFVPVTTQTAEEAYDAVLLGAGAIFPARDAIDTRIIDEVANGYATYDGTQYEINEDLPDTSINRGIIDSQDDVGGWPELQSLPAPTDTDHDGMPDDWEIAHGLNPDDPEDRNTQSSSGYTMLEDYLNELTPLRIDREGHHKPFSFRLHQNYPNPFNSSTIIRFSLEHRATVNLKIYDMLGRQVKQLVQGNLPAGEHDLHWYASNDLGSPVASGLYIILLRSDDEQQLLKTLLIR